MPEGSGQAFALQNTPAAFLQLRRSLRPWLDVGFCKPADPSPTRHSTRKSSGHLRLHFQEQPHDETGRRAKVTIAIRQPRGPVYFTGTIAHEPRPGIVALQLPPLESWQQSLNWLPRMQRDRFYDADFYEILQREITTRFLNRTG